MIQKAIKNKITVTLDHRRFSRANGETSAVGGYFSEDERILYACTGAPYKYWFPTFVHESCHMEQFLEDAKPWKQLTRGNEDACTLVFEWLDTELELNKSKLDWAFKKTQLMELDCEIRTAQKIKEWDLSCSLEEHIKAANAYVLFYNFVKKHRVWSKPRKSPYKSKIIRDMMSTEFDMNYDILPRNYEREVIKFCFDGDIHSVKEKSKLIRAKNQEEVQNGTYRLGSRFTYTRR